ncbi:MAG: type I-B CRISPR-associated protein Cas7/Cst2/DevR [Candidatus Heimdallarchaeota archaeon]|nr:type I-B CRISPR-associated protein Cas7/Cst2/DevR [Candidatus Heimdallarchaeota archaeon]
MTNYIKSISNRKVNYIAGTIIVSADGAFLNGAGLGSGEDKNKSIVKYLWKNKKIPYVSSQAWRRWLRNTLVEVRNWPASELEAIGWNKNGNTAKIAGQLNPLTYPEDDFFGYMFAKGSGSDTVDEKLRRDRLPDTQLVRTSPFKSSLLSGIPDLIHISEDEGFVHLKDDTPLPYTTQFYSGELQAIFGLELYRVGVFDQSGKSSLEIDPYILENNVSEFDEHDHPLYKGKIYARKNLHKYQNKYTSDLITAISELSGGSKLSQFAAPTAPKILICAGLNSPLMLFDNILYNHEGKPAMHIQALKEILSDYNEKFVTPVYIGLRSGYLINEMELRELEVDGIEIIFGTPISVAEQFAQNLN